jgi:hypothetical protein
MKIIQSLFLTAAAVLIFSGCASMDQNAAKKIGAFSAATDLATQNTSAAFESLDHEHFNLTIARDVAEGGWEKLDAKSIAPFLKPEDLQARILVLQGLQAYAEKLSAIMGNAQMDELDKATQDLSASLKNVDDEFVKSKFLAAAPLSSSELRIASTAINAIGHWIIEVKRERGVKASIKEMNPYVTNIVALLARDFEVLRRNQAKTYDEAVMAQKVFVQKNIATLDPITKRNEIKAIADLIIEANNADHTMALMQKSIMQLGETHAQLATAFDKSSVKLDKLLVDLAAEGKRVKKFYDSVGQQ